MELQLHPDVQGGQSVEGWIQETVVVRGHSGEGGPCRRDSAGAALEEWRLVEREEWWRAEYGSREEFAKGNWPAKLTLVGHADDLRQTSEPADHQV